MLPFPIMNQYGNTIRQVQIKKALGGSQSAFILYDDGRLYGAGNNSYGELGLGSYTGWNGATPQWTLIQTDVDDVWAGNNAQGVVTKKGSELYYTGNANARNISGTYYYYSPSTLNVSGAVGDTNYTIIDVCMNRLAIHILIELSDGTRKIYCCGSGNYLGRNSITGSSSLTVSTGVNSTDIIQIGCTGSAFFYLTGTGEMYGTGLNARSQLSTSSTGTYHLTWINQGSALFKRFSTGSDNYIAQSFDNKLYCRGNNSNNIISSSSAEIIYSPAVARSGLSDNCQLVSNGQLACAYIDDNTSIYGIGYTGSLIPGGTVVTNYTLFNTDITDFSNYNSGYSNAFYGSGSNWYMVKNTPTNGIIGEPQSNKSFKLPTNLT